jgi:thiamine-phosphate pyrophosphorylase
MKRLDLRLYAVIDPEHAGGRDPVETARLVAEGGATLVQLRDKRSDTGRMVERARAMKAALAPFSVPLLINDRVDVALAAEAAGVHIGQTDMHIDDARRLLGSKAIIGLSVKTVAQAQAAPVDRIDYAGIGGVYSTTSKHSQDPPIGTAGLERIAKILRRRARGFPVCAIAGIDAANAAETIAAGADGVAVISALTRGADPRAAARELRRIVDAALARPLDAR